MSCLVTAVVQLQLWRGYGLNSRLRDQPLKWRTSHDDAGSFISESVDSLDSGI
jgi:hypothetical protein